LERLHRNNGDPLSTFALKFNFCRYDKAAWMIESKPINLGFGMYLD
jgi:hypothetical protein